MKTNNIYDFLDTCYDFNSQESWDESGMISFGDKEYDVKKIVVALEITTELIDYAIAQKIKLIICHHPLFTKQLEDQFSPNHKFVKRLYENKIDVIAIHTPFDKDVNGMNVALAQKMNLRKIRRINNHNKYVMVGNLDKPMRLDKFAKYAKEQLGSDYAKYVDSFKNVQVSSVAICGGAGGSFVNEVAASKIADVYVTCDMKYHTWNDAYESRIPVIDLNHEIESIFIGVIAKKIQELDPKINIIKYSTHIKMNLIK